MIALPIEKYFDKMESTDQIFDAFSIAQGLCRQLARHQHDICMHMSP